MTTMADEIKAEIAGIDADIAWANEIAEKNADHPESVELARDYAASITKRKLQLQARLDREEAQLVKPQPEGVKIGEYDV